MDLPNGSVAIGHQFYQAPDGKVYQYYNDTDTFVEVPTTDYIIDLLNLKVDKTTTVNGHALSSNVTVTKGDVGLGNADNTSDLNKPISTATQAALNLKEDLANKSNAALGSSITLYPTQGAVKTYVDAAISANTGASNLDIGTRTTTTLPITNSNGTGVNLPVATTSLAGLQSSEDKTKIDGIATGATANQSDAYLLSRTNHTGSQAISTVTGLQTALDDKQSLSEKGMNNGYASLDGSGKVPATQLPTGAQVYKGIWDASTNSPTLADGVGTSGWVYSVSVAGTQNLGSGSISFGVGDEVIYNGTVWQKKPSGVFVTSVNGQTGAVNLTKSDIGLGNVDNTSDATKNIGGNAATATSAPGWGSGSAGGVITTDFSSASDLAPSTIFGYDSGATKAKLFTPTALRLFQGSPSGGETLASVTARGAASTGDVIISGIITSTGSLSGSFKTPFRNTNVDSRSYRFLNDISVYGDFKLQKSTGQNETFEDVMSFATDKTVTFANQVVSSGFVGDLNGNALTATNGLKWNNKEVDYSSGAVVPTAVLTIDNFDGKVRSMNKSDGQSFFDVNDGTTLNNNISGNSATTTNFGGREADLLTDDALISHFATINSGGDGKVRISTTAQVNSVLGINLKAPLASPEFTGTPTAPDVSANDNSGKIANTKYVDAGLAAKQNLVTLTTTGSGAASFNQSTGALNIPTPSTTIPTFQQVTTAGATSNRIVAITGNGGGLAANGLNLFYDSGTSVLGNTVSSVLGSTLNFTTQSGSLAGAAFNTRVSGSNAVNSGDLLPLGQAASTFVDLSTDQNIDGTKYFVGNIEVAAGDGSGGIVPFAIKTSSNIFTIDNTGKATGLAANFGNSYLGTWSLGSTYAQFSHKDFATSSTDYGLIQGDGGEIAIGTSSSLSINAGQVNIQSPVDVNQSVTATQFRLSSLNTAPASSTDTGSAGEVRITTDYIYVCVAANTWKRTALSTW